jgi:hypothetical protein
MALNPHDRKVILESSGMLQRVAGAVLKYANYLINLPSPTAGQASWAKQAALNANGVAGQVAPLLFQEANFAGVVVASDFTCGSDITTDQLEDAVEAAINDHFIVEP